MRQGGFAGIVPRGGGSLRVEIENEDVANDLMWGGEGRDRFFFVGNLSMVFAVRAGRFSVNSFRIGEILLAAIMNPDGASAQMDERIVLLLRLARMQPGRGAYS